MKVTVFWFRRDLRLDDNTALNLALKSGNKVLPIFIFDKSILEHLPKNDARVNFIYEQLISINKQLEEFKSSLSIFHGNPIEVWKEIINKHNVSDVYFNHDYEPYAFERDKKVSELLASKNIHVSTSKDQVIFEKDEVLKKDGKPYSVFTPYKKTWLEKFNTIEFKFNKPEPNFLELNTIIPTLKNLGFETASIPIPEINKSHISDYDEIRDFPAIDGGTNLGIYLRFGTISIRKLVKYISKENLTLLSELIWREFFMQILYHFPRVQHGNFYKKYDGIEWINNEEHFKLWCQGKTGYPLVDAGMRELNKTGRMHNRVRMVVASFLCKHLLIDWKWGEAFFAEKLLDYELSANNGNWQWAAGTGCDASPYFRVFNPSAQQQKFDKKGEYINKWIPELNSLDYPNPIVEHAFGRNRAIETYKKGIIG